MITETVQIWVRRRGSIDHLQYKASNRYELFDVVSERINTLAKESAHDQIVAIISETVLI